jgi:predicted ATPase
MAERLADCLEIPESERAAFVQAARAELTVDRMQAPGDLLPESISGEQPRPDRLQAPNSIEPLTAAAWPIDAIPLNNLVAQPTELLGRDELVRDVCAMLRRSDVRLLTLTGAPGIGKSRLGRQAAAELLRSFADGVFVVNLTLSDTPVQAAEAISQALSLRDNDTAPAFERLKTMLHTRELLLVLDNFERLIATAPLIAELLAAAPRIKLLITSRAALRISAEHERPVPPLPLPDPDAALAALADNPAVALFAARARAVRPDFALGPQNISPIAAICNRLDGLPLAIELAAARIKLLAPPTILSRLQHRLSLLTDGARDLPAHQRTLRSAIAWSYELLAPAERQLFARLAVFAGGCTLETVEAIAGEAEGASRASGGLVDEQYPVLDGLAALADNSMLQQRSGPGGEPRFAMLETLREFALEQLARQPEAEHIHREHALFFMRLAETCEQRSHSPEQLAAVERLRDEHDNLRAALQWAIDRRETAIAMRLSGALGWFWDTQGVLSEGRRWSEAALALGETDEPLQRARALASAALLAGDQDDIVVARDLFGQALALFRQHGDESGAAYALSYLGRVLRQAGEIAEAETRLREGLKLFEQLGDRRGAALSSYHLGRAAHQRGDEAIAQQLFAESLAQFQSASDSWGMALSLTSLGRIAYRRADYRAARSAYEQSLSLFEQLGDVWGQALARCKLGWVAFHQGDGLAQRYFMASLAAFRRVPYPEGVADALAGLGALALRDQRWELAAKLFGAASGIRADIGARLLTTDPEDDTAWHETLRTQLDEHAFATAWNAGQTTPLEQLVATIDI